MKKIIYIGLFILVIGIILYILNTQHKPSSSNPIEPSSLFVNSEDHRPFIVSNQGSSIAEFSSLFPDSVKLMRTELNPTKENGVLSRYILIAPSAEPHNKYCTDELKEQYQNLYRCLPTEPSNLNEIVIFDYASQNEVIRYTLEPKYSLASFKGYYKPSPCEYDTVVGTEIPTIKYDKETESWAIIVKAYYWDSFDDLGATQMHIFSIDTKTGYINESASSTIDIPKEFTELSPNENCAYKNGNF